MFRTGTLPNEGERYPMQVSPTVRDILETTGWGQAVFAKKIGVSQGTVSKWLSEKQSPNKKEWDEVVGLVRSDPRLAHLRYEVETGSVAVGGRVGAGSTIEPDVEQIPPEGLYTVSLPFPVPADMIGFVVEGDSMLPKYDSGDVIVVYKDQRQETRAYLGQLVAVLTEDGRRYLKKIFPGTAAGLYRLESFNAGPIHDVSVVWVGEIYAVLPATQAIKTAPVAKKVPARTNRAAARK